MWNVKILELWNSKALELFKHSLVENLGRKSENHNSLKNQLQKSMFMKNEECWLTCVVL